MLLFDHLKPVILIDTQTVHIRQRFIPADMLSINPTPEMGNPEFSE